MHCAAEIQSLFTGKERDAESELDYFGVRKRRDNIQSPARIERGSNRPGAAFIVQYAMQKAQTYLRMINAALSRWVGSMTTNSEWNEIREDLRTQEPQKLNRATVRVGKIEVETIPEDIVDALLNLFTHPEPEIRGEAIFALGLHWRLSRTIKPIADILEYDDDWHVRLRAISALGALGREHSGTQCGVSKALANAVLNGRLADYERMNAYIELQHVEGMIAFEEALARDQGLPDKLVDFEIDRPWVEDLARRECPEPSVRERDRTANPE